MTSATRRRSIAVRQGNAEAVQRPTMKLRVGSAISACRLHPRLRTYGRDADNRRFGPIGGRTKQKPRDIGDASSLLTPRLLLLSLDEP